MSHAHHASLLLALFALTGCSHETAPPADPCADHAGSLDERLDAAMTSGDLPGLVLHLDVGGSVTTYTRGVADQATNMPMPGDALFRTASNGKLFLGTLAAILAEEGAIDLDVPVAPLLDPDVVAHLANGSQITLRQLLEHRSGLPDFTDNPDFERAVRADPTHEWSDAEAVSYAFDRPATSAPGTRFAYSNTGYCVASLALARVTGAHPSVALRQDVLVPFGLSDTSWENHESFDETRLVHGYEDIDGDGVPDDVRGYELLSGLGAGGLVSTASDLGRFYRALFAGQGFPDATYDRQALLARILSNDVDHYGLGVNYVPGVYAHSGDVPGYRSFVAYVASVDTSAVLFVNRAQTTTEDTHHVEAQLQHLWDGVICSVIGR